MQVLHAVRRHFAETQHPLPVVLVLEEAGALDLATPFVLSAFRELRKAGLAIHLISQSSLDFGEQAAFEALLANAPSQVWYQCLAPADQELGSRALTNAMFEPLAVHFSRKRSKGKSEPHYKSPQLQHQEYATQLARLQVGQRLVRTRGGVKLEQGRQLRESSHFDRLTRAAIDRIRARPIFQIPAPEPEPTRPLPDAGLRLLGGDPPDVDTP